MKDTRYLGAVVLAGFAGPGLFYLIRLLESILRGTLLINALLEEAIKLGLFFLLWASVRITGKKRPLGFQVFLYPLFTITGFGIWENIYYFAGFPSSAIYFRLLYSYPIHLNTALVYALVFLLNRPLLAFPLLGASILYHFGLNALSLSQELSPLIYGVAVVNILLFILLTLKIKNERDVIQGFLKGVS